jgi:phosphotransferase system enzyme I (PtsI)
MDCQVIDAQDVAGELARWQEARAKAQSQLAAIQARAEETVGQDTATIFAAQALMLEDPALLEFVERKIRDEHLSAPAALSAAADFYAGVLAALPDESWRARAADVHDVAQRVIRLLLGIEDTSLATLSRPSIIVAEDLTPSDTAVMSREFTLGFCTAGGGMTAHTAILARANGWPAVVGMGQAWAEIVDGETLIVDGSAGLVIAAPDEATMGEYRKRQLAWRQACAVAQAEACQPAVTLDGRHCEDVANIGDVASAQAALALGAEGVGLLRTEFLFLDRATAPDEEEQYRAYTAIAAVLEQRPLIVRTLDVGGDKPPPYLELAPEANPFLGWRGLRISLAQPELLKTQLRAILRAGVGRQVKVMFPMVASVEEVRAGKRLLDEARQELRRRGLPFAAEMAVGIMVEAPAAAVAADLLAPEVDFFSLGTNDLTQYTLAVDRSNARLAPLYDPLHPAELRLIKLVIEAGHRAGKWVGMCGEMAGDLEAIPLLVGLGLDEFSMNAPAIPAAKALIRRLDGRAMGDLVARAWQMTTAEEIRALGRGW